MDDKTKASYEQKSKQIRADLKKWENDWAAENGGGKPSRQDIKDNPSIAAKYKEYNKTRDILAGKIPVPTANQDRRPNPKKRRPDPPSVETPLKKNKYAETPVKNRTIDDDDQLMSTPAISRKLFSPAPVTCIGPTPQRDGKVLGLFDLLVSRELGTPSKTGAADGTLPPPPTTPGGRRQTADNTTTPSTRRGSADGRRLGRTPMSSSKRHMLNSFMTPLKNRDAAGGKTTHTPGSVSKLQFDTPAFLRRHNTLPALNEGAAFDAPAPLRLPRKPLGRGLSEIVASLRKVEDDKLDDDDDMAALREAEGIDSGPARPSTAPATAPKESDILARDRDAAHLPLGGFDDEGLHDSPDEAEHLGRDGQPLAVFKKKGQKRTTKRVNMRPTITRRPTAPLDDSQDVVVPEGTTSADGEYNAADDDGDYGATSGKKKPAKEGVVKKSVRKVNELAHANFRRLKLKSKNMKGKPGGFGRRFGRR